MLVNLDELEDMIGNVMYAKHNVSHKWDAFFKIEKFLYDIKCELECADSVTIFEEKPFNGDE